MREYALTIGLFLLFLTSAIAPSLATQPSSSSDSCVKYASNPVLVPGTSGQWDSLIHSGGGVGRTSVLFNGSQFLMWYSSFGQIGGIGLATSRDGASWTKAPGPVLQNGTQGRWDSYFVYAPSVVWNGSSYLMYYTGESSSNSWAIGLAYSTDGVHWTKYSGNPVLSPGPGAYDSLWVRYPSVIYEAASYEMWYTGHAPISPGSPTLANIDFATSRDGIHWTKFAGNPIVPSNDQSFSGVTTARFSSVVKVESIYLMATDLGFGSISYLTSNNGTNWKVSGALVSSSSSGSAWDAQASYPSLLVAGSRIMMWYTGENGTNSAIEQVGLASCPFLMTHSTVTVTSVSVITSSVVWVQATTQITISTVTETTGLQTTAAYALAGIGVVGMAVVAIILLWRRGK